MVVTDPLNRILSVLKLKYLHSQYYLIKPQTPLPCRLVERVELVQAKESKVECDSASVEETAPSLCSGGTDADQDLEPKIPVNE